MPYRDMREFLARLEAASNEPLHGELTQLLNAIQVGFGARSAQIDPALRPYTVRMASRFEWNPDTFRIAVAAPSAELAAARANDITYNRFVQGLRLAGVTVDRKVLADLAVTDPTAFSALAEVAKAAVAAEGTGGASTAA